VIIDLKLNNKTIMIVGGGTEAHRKLQSMLNANAKIWVISREFCTEIQQLGTEKQVALLKTGIRDAQAFVDSLNPKPYILLAATNDPNLNTQLVKAAKYYGCMVYSIDNPDQSDFILPAVAHVGDVKIAVSTSGKSPAMAHVLRERIENLITKQDLHEIELQAKARAILKATVLDAKQRTKTLYDILNSVEIKQALSQGKLAEAEELAMKLIQKVKPK